MSLLCVSVEGEVILVEIPAECRLFNTINYKVFLLAALVGLPVATDVGPAMIKGTFVHKVVTLEVAFCASCVLLLESNIKFINSALKGEMADSIVTLTNDNRLTNVHGVKLHIVLNVGGDVIGDSGVVNLSVVTHPDVRQSNEVLESWDDSGATEFRALGLLHTVKDISDGSLDEVTVGVVEGVFIRVPRGTVQVMDSLMRVWSSLQ